ncbi:MAG: hypothetical protein COV44_02805 [Deltaproteobacteria bacterium CG11_big_fil_rev_8_21_14_0_20_45_16]|nr:MAG: hypothetical protein COV44_02805 [Deltaproteobacteria bacterium CG11_big_fil_rev_8_21_14_0_20_45_16]
MKNYQIKIRKAFSLVAVLAILAVLAVIVASYMKQTEIGNQLAGDEKSHKLMRIQALSGVDNLRESLRVCIRDQLSDGDLVSPIDLDLCQFSTPGSNEYFNWPKCMGEGPDPQLEKCTTSTKLANWPKTYSIEYQIQNLDASSRLRATQTVEYSKTDLSDYALLVRQERKDSVTFGSGEYFGKTSVFFDLGNAEPVIHFNPSLGALTFHKKFSTNLPGSKLDIGKGSEVSFLEGVAPGSPYPDFSTIYESFDELRENADYGYMIHNDGGGNEPEGNILRSELTFTREDGNNNDEACRAKAVIYYRTLNRKGNNEEQALVMFDQSLEEDKVYNLPGPVTVQSENPTQVKDINACPKNVTILGGSFSFTNSIVSSQAVDEMDKFLVFMALGDIEVAGAESVPRVGPDARLIDLHDQQDNQSTFRLDASLIAVDGSITVDPALYSADDPSTAYNLGLLEINGMILSGELTNTKKIIQNKIDGFDRVNLHYPKGLGSQPPRSLKVQIGDVEATVISTQIGYFDSNEAAAWAETPE